jgi:hypothetical protein
VNAHLPSYIYVRESHIATVIVLKDMKTMMDVYGMARTRISMLSGNR